RPVPVADHPSTRQLGTVAEAGEEQLGGFFKRAFKAGHHAQRSAVDLAFGVVSTEVLDPNRIVALSADLLRKSTSAVRTLLPGSQPGDSGSWRPPRRRVPPRPPR